MVLFFMDLSTRRVEIAGISAIANGFWMSQVARNLTDAMDGLLKGKRYLIHDRDPLFTAEFLSTLAEAGTKSVKLPPRSPNLNSYAERFVRSIKEGCLDRMILFGEEALRIAVREFVAHYYHCERRALSRYRQRRLGTEPMPLPLLPVLRRYGSATLLRHHTKKNGSTARNKKPPMKQDHSKGPSLRKRRPPRRSNSRRRQGIRKSTGATPIG